MNAVKVTIVFDNTTLVKEATPEWGFACVLEFPNETILFDTGNDGDILLKNLAALGFVEIAFSKIIISHMHWDHTGGLHALLERIPDAKVYVPDSATLEEVSKIESMCKQVIRVKEPLSINDALKSLGELPGRASEQSLAITCKAGLVIVTGCAHPGIVEIVERAQELSPNQPIALCCGGFHLNKHSKSEVLNIIQTLKQLEVQQVSPTHCTGEQAIALFAEKYGDGFVRGGVGATFEFELEEK